jgi:ABC-type antimicrobial peptide transport system permease subunit
MRDRINSSRMLRNYFKVAFRNLVRSKGFTFINVSGLAVGMATAIIIFVWIHHEVSFDTFHVNQPNIYQAWNRGRINDKIECWPYTPKVLGPTLKAEYEEVAEVARTFNRWFVTIVDDRKVSTKALIADPSFLKIFTFPLLEGNAGTALNDGYSIVVTEKMALKMFDDIHALGKEIKIDNELYRVTGVMKDLPPNTDFDFEYILSSEYVKRTNEDDMNWANNGIFTYVQLNDGHSFASVSEKIKDVIIRHSEGLVKEEIILHPISRWHLYSRFENGKYAGGRIETVQLFAVIGGFVLLVACINFMNLSTARSEKRAKEVGVRKVAGADKTLLVGQFLIESILLTGVSAGIAVVLVQLMLPYFSTLVGQTISVPFTQLYFWIALIAFTIATGIIAGSYPAFFLSSFKPVTVLKGTFKKSSSRINPRKILVVTQFTFAIVLIIATMVVVQQIRYTQTRDRGYNAKPLVYHWMTGALYENYIPLKNELINSGIASGVTKTLSPMSMIMSDTWDLQWQGKNPEDKTDFGRMSADEGLVETASLQLIQGRDMDLQKYPTDSTAMLINEAAAKAFGFKEPIGQTIKEADGTEYHIIGVVKDFITGSPYQTIKPLVIEGVKGSGFNVIHIKLKEGIYPQKAIAGIQALFQKYNPEYPFEFHFSDDDYAQKFEDTERTASLTSVFTILTIFISCLGLFGLASYMAEVRIKEIGIRKVLGASVARITILLSKDFATLVLIAILLGTPLAWYAMDQWLQSFTYRTPINVWTFALAGALCITLALVTVGYQSIKAALENPVKNLRNE